MAVIQKAHYGVDLAGLQAICERNYFHLMRLLPAIKTTGYSRFIAFTSDQRIMTQLAFNVLENTPYTSYVHLRQSSLLGWLASPQLYIRCYHDVRLAEVVFAQNTRSFRGVYAYPNSAMHQPDEKKQLNSFVEEWLIQCLSAGYEVREIALGQ